MSISYNSKELSSLVFDDKGLITAVVQDYGTKDVLMVAHMNQDALNKTLETGDAWFFSRSRQSLWHKGATSGNTLRVMKMTLDCDADCLLLLVQPAGPACHTGERSCFYRLLHDFQGEDLPKGKEETLGEVLDELYRLIETRKVERPEKSYTTYLFNEGQDKILKKIGEEAAEIIIASKNNVHEEVVYESSDFIYHLLVLLANHEISLITIAKELSRRR